MSKAEDIKNLMGWFAIDVELPKEGQRVLVIVEKEDSAFSAIFTAGPDGFHWVEGTVAYWMPLPAELTTSTEPLGKRIGGYEQFPHNLKKSGNTF